MKKRIHEFVRNNREKVIEFQKKFAISRAADVLTLYEKLVKEENLNVDLSKLRKNILANLVVRHKDKEPDEEYWSMKLLI